MIKEFREFISRGSVVDLAVGIIIGTAFTSIVRSLVDDIIMPPIGVLLGDVDFSAIVITLQEASGDDPAVTMNIGLFINALLTFIIVAVAVFFLVKAVNRINRQQEEEEAEEAPAEPTTEEKLVAVLERLDAKLDDLP